MIRWDDAMLADRETGSRGGWNAHRRSGGKRCKEAWKECGDFVNTIDNRPVAIELTEFLSNPSDS